MLAVTAIVAPAAANTGTSRMRTDMGGMIGDVGRG